MNQPKFYRCAKCGNIVALLKNGGGQLVCCNEPMKELKANSTDAAQEKHVPVAEVSGDKLCVTVGSVEHPMTPEHHIEWIALATENELKFAYLTPNQAPKAEFHYSKEDGTATVYAYCNLHGLWKCDL